MYNNNFTKIGEATLSQSEKAVIIRIYGKDRSSDAFLIMSKDKLKKMINKELKYAIVSKGDKK